MTDEELRYPTGRFKPPVSYTQHNINTWINDIKTFPGKLRKEVIGLTEKQLDTQYRTGGWTIRQVVHHLADSHMNSLIRFKWALTEENPTIKAYEEADWALLPDYRLPIEPSLKKFLRVSISTWAPFLTVLPKNNGIAPLCTPKPAPLYRLSATWPYIHGTANTTWRILRRR